MMMTRTLATISALVALGASVATADRVVVLGSAQQVHPVTGDAAAAFTPAGLAELAMGSFGLPTGVVETVRDSVIAPTEKAAANPVLADVFQRVNAYTQVFVDAADAAVLEKLTPPKAADFHAAFPLEKGAVEPIPAAVAAGLDAKTTLIKCVGSSAMCDHAVLPHDDVDAAKVQDVLKANSFLQDKEAADMALAQELAQTQQLIAALEAADKPEKAYLAVSYSSAEALASAKQAPARDAVAKSIQDLVEAVQKAYPKNGVQIVAAGPTPKEELESISRMLLAEGSTASSTTGSLETATTTAPKKASAVNATDSAVNATLNAAVNDSSATNSSKNYTEAQIIDYQIILWTACGLAATLALIMVPMCSMDSHKDSLVYAKFTTNTHKFD